MLRTLMLALVGVLCAATDAASQEKTSRLTKRVSLDLTNGSTDREYLPAGEPFNFIARARNELKMFDLQVGAGGRFEWSRLADTDSRAITVPVDAVDAGTTIEVTWSVTRRMNRSEQQKVVDAVAIVLRQAVLERDRLSTLQDTLSRMVVAASSAIQGRTSACTDDDVLVGDRSPFARTGGAAAQEALDHALGQRRIPSLVARRAALVSALANNVSRFANQKTFVEDQDFQALLERATRSELAGDLRLRQAANLATDVLPAAPVESSLPNDVRLWETVLDGVGRNVQGVRRLLTELKLSRHGNVRGAIPVRTVDALEQRATALWETVASLRADAAELRSATETLLRSVRQVSGDLRRIVESDVELVRRCTKTMQVAPAYSGGRSLGFGLLLALGNPSKADSAEIRLVPHAAVYFDYEHAFLSLGATFATLAEPGLSDDLFWSSNLIGGAGVRIAALRFTVGAVVHQRRTDTRHGWAARPFVAISVAPIRGFP